MLHPKKICRSCGAIPKAGISFSRHIPNAAIVTEHLKKATDYDIVIAPQDVLCFSCYKLHCSILKSLNSSNDNEGSDSSLQQNIKAWKNTNDGTDLLTSAVLSAVLFVAENLIQQKAVLLPWACQIFLQAYCNDQTGSTSTQLTLEIGESNVKFTSQWLLNQLIFCI